MLPKKKSLKKAIFGPKPWVNLFGKMSIFQLFELVFLQPRKALFRSRISRKTFSGLCCLKEKKLKTYSLLDQNHGLTPLEKCGFFAFLRLLFQKSSKGFFFLEYRKKHFPGLHCLKKKNYENWPLLDQNHGLTSLEKCQFFDFFNFLFLSPRKAFFFLEYRKRHFSGLHCLKTKSWKNGRFWTKTIR